VRSDANDGPCASESQLVTRLTVFLVHLEETFSLERESWEVQVGETR
jgi:hypothetical protein